MISPFRAAVVKIMKSLEHKLFPSLASLLLLTTCTAALGGMRLIIRLVKG